METHCEVCKAEVIVDKSPLFGTVDPIEGVYIARITKACKTGCCLKRKNGAKGKTPRSIDLIPVDSSRLFLTQLQFRKLIQEQRKDRDEETEKSGLGSTDAGTVNVGADVKL